MPFLFPSIRKYKNRHSVLCLKIKKVILNCQKILLLPVKCRKNIVCMYCSLSGRKNCELSFLLFIIWSGQPYSMHFKPFCHLPAYMFVSVHNTPHYFSVSLFLMWCFYFWWSLFSAHFSSSLNQYYNVSHIRWHYLLFPRIALSPRRLR